MRNILFLLFSILLTAAPAMGESLYGSNKLDDQFSVTAVDGHQAILTGTAKGLKPGDQLFHLKSPFQFKVSAVKGDKVTIILPERHDLAAGTILLRLPTPSIKKGIDTEAKLKQALEE